MQGFPPGLSHGWAAAGVGAGEKTFFMASSRMALGVRNAAEEAEAIASAMAQEEASLVRLPAGSNQPIDSLEAIEMHRQRMERRFRSDLERDRTELLDFERRLFCRMCCSPGLTARSHRGCVRIRRGTRQTDLRCTR